MSEVFFGVSSLRNMFFHSSSLSALDALPFLARSSALLFRYLSKLPWKNCNYHLVSPDIVNVLVPVVVLALFLGLDGDLDDGARPVEHFLPDCPVVLLVVERVDLSTTQ